jgi:mannose-6-phosphate isomerase
VDRDGKRRQLHIQQALDVTDFARGPVNPVTPITTNDHVERLVQCEKFILDRLRLSASHALAIDNRFHILTVVEGTASINTHIQNYDLQRGGTVLVPATTRNVKIASQGRAVLLDMYLP